MHRQQITNCQSDKLSVKKSEFCKNLIKFRLKKIKSNFKNKIFSL